MRDFGVRDQRDRFYDPVEAQRHWPAGTAGARVVRPLGCVERFFHLYSLACPVHFCFAAHIEGAMDVTLLAAALEQVRKRHPMLRVCIADTEMGPVFCETDKPIAFRLAATDGGADWRGIVESELDLSFETASGPLMRVTVLWTQEGAVLVLTFHHAIADALSGTRILEDLLRALSGADLEPLRLLPPIEQILSGPALAPQGAPAADKVSKARPQATPAPKPFAAKLSILQWNRKDTARLIQCCKAKDTTVHGAICAAVSRCVPACDVDANRMHCPMDLSRLAGADVDGCGVFIGAGIVEVLTKSRNTLWHDARDIADGLQAARSPAGVARMLEWIAAQCPPTADKDVVAEFLASQPPSSAVISNLGVLPLAAHYGPLSLKAVWGPAMLTNPPADRQTIGINTFDGRLRMVHQSFEPISGLLEAIRGTLLSWCAACGDSG